MIFETVLFADVDWVRILILLIFVLGPLLGQFARKEPAKAAPKPARRPPRDKLESQMRKILAQANQAGERNQPPEATVGPPGPPRRERKTRPTVKQPPVPPRSTTSRPNSVSDHVREHILSHPVSEHSQELARTLDQTDERVEMHLRDVFDHRLGDLKTKADAGHQVYEVADGTDLQVWEQSARERGDRQLADDRRALLDLLSRPEQLRNVFVLGEILRPPVSLDDETSFF